MEHHITATELVRSLGDVLARVRYRNDVFTVERNGEPVAQVIPVPSHSATTVLEGLRAWREGYEPDPDLADELERIGAADRPPEDPWAS